MPFIHELLWVHDSINITTVLHPKCQTLTNIDFVQTCNTACNFESRYLTKYSPVLSIGEGRGNKGEPGVSFSFIVSGWFCEIGGCENRCNLSK